MLSSRKEAKESGDKFYFTGNPCIHGHVSKRQTVNGCCYECSLIKSRAYQAANLEKKRDYKEKNKEHIRLKDAEYRKANKERLEQYRLDNKEAIRAREKEYNKRNKDRIKYLGKKYYEENKDKFLEHSRKRYARVKDDIDFRLKKVMRQNLRRLMIDPSIKSSTPIMLGYDSVELRRHMESLFTEGMSWDNYGEWHIDHIIPIDWFLKNGIKEASIINELKNLQPLWAEDNLEKKASLEWSPCR